MNKVIDLFCGGGGMSEGFRQAGFDVALGVDFNAHAIATHHQNFPESISIHADITTLDPKKVLTDNGISKDEVVGVIGGFPCQGYSIAGKRWVDDPRNRLFLECVRFVKEVEPKFFVFENVPGLLSFNEGRAKDEIVEEFAKLGFNVDYKVLVATDFGVAQMRKRVFFIGFKEGNPVFPEKTHQTPVTVGEILDDLPKLGIKDGADILYLDDGTVLYNHFSFGIQDITLQRISHIPEGGNYKDIPIELRREKDYQSAFRRLHRDKPSYTIHTHFRDEFLIHPTQDRIITVREAARIQSFPDTFQFCGPKNRTGQLGAVGNAVPPLLAKAIAVRIKEELFI